MASAALGPPTPQACLSPTEAEGRGRERRPVRQRRQPPPRRPEDGGAAAARRAADETQEGIHRSVGALSDDSRAHLFAPLVVRAPVEGAADIGAPLRTGADAGGDLGDRRASLKAVAVSRPGS